MKIAKCKKCSYFSKAEYKEWNKMIGVHIFGDFGLKHKILRVCGHCIDSENPDFNVFAKATGRGIGKIEAFLRPKWCRCRNK